MQLLIRKGFLSSSSNLEADFVDPKYVLNASRDPAYTATKAIVAKNLSATRDEACSIPISQYNVNYVFSPGSDNENNAGNVRVEGDDKIDELPLTTPTHQISSTFPRSSLISTDSEWIQDQGPYGASVVNAIAYSIRLVRQTRKLPDFPPSRFFLYYFARVIEGRCKEQDSGIYISSGLEALAKHSVCSEGLWAYDDKKIYAVPSEYATTAAGSHEPMGYISVAQNIKNLKTLLLHGYPIVFGFTVFASFMSAATAKSGIWSGPTQADEQNGGQAAVLIGYDDGTGADVGEHDRDHGGDDKFSEGVFIVANSFSRKWGLQGTVRIPYSYILNKQFARDFHTLYVANFPIPPPYDSPCPPCPP